MYVVQSQDLFNFRDEYASSHPDIAFNYMKVLESIHGKKYRVLKR